MSERFAYAIDDSRWPLVLARATEFSGDAAAIEASYRRLERILARNKPFALMFDMRGTTSTPTRRKRFQEWCGRNEDALTRLLLVGALVARSSFERGLITAALWFRETPWPMRVFDDPEPAQAWLVEQFAALTKARDAGA